MTRFIYLTPSPDTGDAEAFYDLNTLTIYAMKRDGPTMVILQVNVGEATMTGSTAVLLWNGICDIAGMLEKQISLDKESDDVDETDAATSDLF